MDRAPLFYTAVLNVIVAPSPLVLVMRAASDERVMGAQRIGPLLAALGWIATAGMFLALAGLAAVTLSG